jgi:hypothetical protein
MGGHSGEGRRSLAGFFGCDAAACERLIENAAAQAADMALRIMGPPEPEAAKSAGMTNEPSTL